MTKQEKLIQSEIKRLNTRISAIAKNFGLQSEYYKNVTNAFKYDTFSNLVHYTNKGVLQLNTNVSSIRDKSNEYLLNIARKRVKIISQLRKETGLEDKNIPLKEVVKEVERRQKTRNIMDRKKAYLYDHYTPEERKRIAPELYKDGKLTPEELEQTIVNIERERVHDLIDFELDNVNEDIKEELHKIVNMTEDLELLEELTVENLIKLPLM